jgi:hypothetical protein
MGAPGDGDRRLIFAGQVLQFKKLGLTNLKFWQTF